jgi:lysophospholipase L1-like esterase
VKIVILADSLVLPRDKETLYEETYSYLLDQSLKKIYRERSPIIIERGARARTIIGVLNDWFELVQLRSPEIVIVHVGVADCAPRLLLQKAHSIVDKIRPIQLRDKFLNFLSQNRRIIISLFPPKVYVPIDIFEKLVLRVISRAKADGVKRLIFVNIIRPTDSLELRSPGFRKNVELYNSCLSQSVFGNPNLSLVDLDKIIAENGGAESLTTDGMHINSQGHAMLAGRLQELIMEIYPV